MSDSHHSEHHHSAPVASTFPKTIEKLAGIFDGPATFLGEKIWKNGQKEQPYYHRQYKRVPTIDECAYGDHVCAFEANEQYLRDKKVDNFITVILSNRVKECYQREGPYDGFEKCRKLDDDYNLAITNYFIKYGDLGANATAIDAYMKQKHRLVWQRRNPTKDIVGLEKQQEIMRKEISEYHQRITRDPTTGKL